MQFAHAGIFTYFFIFVLFYFFRFILCFRDLYFKCEINGNNNNNNNRSRHNSWHTTWYSARRVTSAAYTPTVSKLLWSSFIRRSADEIVATFVEDFSSKRHPLLESLWFRINLCIRGYVRVVVCLKQNTYMLDVLIRTRTVSHTEHKPRKAHTHAYTQSTQRYVHTAGRKQAVFTR
jgi:hypothetical protein